MVLATRDLPQGLRPQGVTRLRVRRHLATGTPRRAPWPHQATPQGDPTRSPRTQRTRLTAARPRAPQARHAAQARLRQLASPLQAPGALPTVDVGCVARPLVGVARLGWRASARVLRLLAWALGLTTAPWPHTRITGVTRLARVRSAAARMLQGLPLSQAAVRNGRRGMRARRMGWGTGQRVAVWACEAQHPQRTPGALALARVPGLGGSVAEAWTGATRAQGRGRLSAVRGRPAASRHDGGSDVHHAVAVRGPPGLPSPCRDAIAHAVAGMRTPSAQAPPPCAPCGAAWGRVSGTRQPTMLAGRRPPYAPRPAFCRATACAPGPIGGSNARQPGAPSRARPAPRGRRGWRHGPPAQPCSRGCEPRLQACGRAAPGPQALGRVASGVARLSCRRAPACHDARARARRGAPQLRCQGSAWWRGHATRRGRAPGGGAPRPASAGRRRPSHARGSRAGACRQRGPAPSVDRAGHLLDHAAA
jgi:hypothetical protein